MNDSSVPMETSDAQFTPEQASPERKQSSQESQHNKNYPTGSLARVYTEASSQWVRGAGLQIPGTDPWALGFISGLSPSSHCPAWLPTAPGQGLALFGGHRAARTAPRHKVE